VTSLAAWPGIDSRGLSTLYIVADSRISWPGSSDLWEFGAKVFASSHTPDIFGFYGDVLVPSMVLPASGGNTVPRPRCKRARSARRISGGLETFGGCSPNRKEGSFWRSSRGARRNWHEIDAASLAYPVVVQGWLV
jgi:hypothetical protein